MVVRQTNLLLHQWANQAGLITSQDQFVDIYGLDPDLLNIIPKPIKAVILLFPSNSLIKTKQEEFDEEIAEEGQHPIDQTVIYVKQYVENACGTIALIHAIANSTVTYMPESPLKKFIDLCQGKTPEECGRLLESTDVFTKIHLQSSALGQTRQPLNDDDEMNTNLHFTCFVAAPDAQIRKTVATR
ncbi:ubiquitinyl hydrolase 1 [Leucoagaricus gongylophorus]